VVVMAVVLVVGQSPKSVAARLVQMHRLVADSEKQAMWNRA